MRFYKDMRQPVQVWAPLFYKSPFGDFSLDLERVYSQWQNEDRIWLMPEATKVIRWKVEENGLVFYEAAVPSDSLNVISIYHIDELGKVYPPYSDTGDNIIETRLYKKWLKTYPEFYEGASTIEVKLPIIQNDRFSHYEWKKIRIKPGPIVPITDVNADEYTITTKWPPQGRHTPSIISPEVESRNFYGKLKFEKLKYKIGSEEKEIDVVSSEKQPVGKAINLWNKWPEPFCSLFPDGGNIDLIYHHAHMRNLIGQIEFGGSDRQNAIQKAANWVNKFIGDGETTLGKAFILPRLITNIDSLLVDVQGRYGIEVSDIDELFKSDEFKQLFFEKIKIKRIYSWLGYFWWEFYKDISTNVNVRFCKNCGNVITGGRSDKIYCTREENKECYRQWQALRQKKRYYNKK